MVARQADSSEVETTPTRTMKASSPPMSHDFPASDADGSVLYEDNNIMRAIGAYANDVDQSGLPSLKVQDDYPNTSTPKKHPIHATEAPAHIDEKVLAHRRRSSGYIDLLERPAVTAAALRLNGVVSKPKSIPNLKHRTTVLSQTASVRSPSPQTPAIELPRAKSFINFTGTSENFGAEQAWYFLRELAGIELEREAGLLHRISDLSLPQDRPIGYENFGQEGDVSAIAETPLLRYLLKNFLLTFPIIRDLSAIEDPLAETDDAPKNSVSSQHYWTSGILPILRELDKRNLSQDIDQGKLSLTSTIFKKHLKDGLERFVAGGLKLSSGAVLGEPGQSNFRNSMLNPLPVPNPTMPNRNMVRSPTQKNRSSLFLKSPRGTIKSINKPDSTPKVSSEETKRQPHPLSADIINRRAPLEEAFAQQPNGISDTDSTHSSEATEIRQNGTQSRLSAVTAASDVRTATESQSSLSLFTAEEGESISRHTKSPEHEEEEEEANNTALGLEGMQAAGNGLLDEPRARHTGLQVSPSKELQATWVEQQNGAHNGLPNGEEAIVETLDPASPRADESALDGTILGNQINGNHSMHDDAKTPTAATAFEPYTETTHPDLNQYAQPPAAVTQAAKKKNRFSLFRSRSQSTSATMTRGNSGTVPLDVLVANEAQPTIPITPQEIIAVPLVKKQGHAWPWGAPVAFWKGTPVSRVEYGGFEVDVVGVRKGLTGHSYLIRTRRPQKLDEYVLRDESQFKKFLAALDKDFPQAHVRRVPANNITPADDAIDARSFAAAMERRKSRRFSLLQPKVEEPITNNFEAVPVPPMPVEGAPVDEAPMTPSRSRFSTRLKEAASNQSLQRTSSQLTIGRKARRNTISDPSKDDKPYKLPAHDAHRRALRNWLRDTLSVRHVGHQRETALFLLLDTVKLKESDIKDIRARESIDEGRRIARVQVAQGAAEQARVRHQWWASFTEDCVEGDGLVDFSDALAATPNVDDLPLKHQKALEWMRTGLAQGIYDIFVAGEQSTSAFGKLRNLHNSFPWFMARQALKLPSSNMMSKTLRDLVLGKAFGKSNLLERVLTTILDDEPSNLLQQIEAARARIQSDLMCERIANFVYAPADAQQLIRDNALEHNRELVLTIVRGGDMPRIDEHDMERVLKAGKVYQAFMSKNPTPIAKATSSNPHVRLVLDLQILLRLLSRERDASQIRSVLAEDTTAQAIEVLIQPFVEFIRRTYKVGKMSDALGDLQKFLDQLIIILDAMRARIQDPQKAVRVIARLLAHHQQNFYTYIHNIHKNDPIIDDCIQWVWTGAIFLRRGLAETIDLDALLPQNPVEKEALVAELDELVEYHLRKRQRQYEMTCRRFAADLDGDDPVIVEGDGEGKSKVEPLVEPEPKKPRVVEIAKCVGEFRRSVISMFTV